MMNAADAHTLVLIEDTLIGFGLIENARDRADRISYPEMYRLRKEDEIAVLQAQIDLIKSRIPARR